jgi:orotate phosphoribosyltransferase
MLTASDFLALVRGRRGHFRMESGYHSGLWLDLEPLFVDAPRIAPWVDALSQALGKHRVDAVCGPLVGGAFLAQLAAHTLGLPFYFTQRLTTASPSDGLFRAQYVLPPALRERVAELRVAIVDDVMSAGSSLRATATELQAHGAIIAVAGTLLALGTTGVDFFEQNGMAVEAVARETYQSWAPAGCPLCAAGMPLEDVT